MKRKVAKAGKLRFSPNEEAMILKEEYERRRKLRLQQVREQERYIALQIRQEVKQRKDEELHQLAENLKAEWLKAQDQKIKALEKLYLSSLRAVGEGHRQAKENEPDLESLAKQREERKQRAEKRHKEALKEQKKQKEKLQTEQTWKVNARKHAICVEKARAAKIASLPPPQPYPFENFEVKKIPTVKVYNADNFSVTHHHLSEPYVDREMDTEQPDAQLVAEEEAKRLKELQKEEERGRREQLEKAHVRGSHALKMVHLAQDRERLMKELEQMQNMDRACRRQIVAQMPPQLFVPSYRRVEIKDDWQRELEMAFEDMYSGDRKMKGDMILQLEPQPLPTPSDQSQDDELDISLEPDSVCERQPRVDEVIEEEVGHHSQSEKREEALQPQSKLALKKLLNKIRSQKDQWASKSEAEVQSDIQTIESGTLPSEERLLCDLEPGHNAHGDSVSEAKESLEILEQRIVAGNSVLIHPQEQAAKIRMEAERQKQNEQIEQQKQEQLALLKQIEEKRMCLEDDYLKIRMQAHLEEIKTRGQEEKDQPSHLAQMNTHSVMNQQTEVEHRTETAAVPETTSPRENDHVQIIRNYQQRLLQQNRLHKQSVEEARKRLQEYQNKLKQRYPSTSSIPLSSTVASESRCVAFKPTLESVLQTHVPAMLQRVHPTACQSTKQMQAQELAQPLIRCSRAHGMLEKTFGQRDNELMQSTGLNSQLRCSLTSELKQRPFQLLQHSPSHKQMEWLNSSNQVRESSESQRLPVSILTCQGTSSDILQPEAQFILPTEDSSESSETLHFEKNLGSPKVPNQQTEAETPKQPLFLVPCMPPTEESLITQAASFDSSECQQIPAESSIKTFEPTFTQAFQHLTSLSLEPGVIQESLASRNKDVSLLNYSNILNLRERVLASSESIQAQQDHLKQLQKQLDIQREALLSRQRMQEELLIWKQTKLKEQMQRKQEAVKDLLNKQVGQFSPYREMTETQKPDQFNLFKGTENYQDEVICGNVNKYNENGVLSWRISPAEQIEQSQKIPVREQKCRTSKPPLAKIKLGLNLEQHELSVIPEVDTPRSWNVSLAGKPDSPGEETSFSGTEGELTSNMCSHESLNEERDLSRVLASSKEQSSNDSLRQSEQSSSSWHELQMVDAESLCDPGLSQDSVIPQHSPVFSANTGRGIAADSGLFFSPNCTVALPGAPPSSLSSQACLQEATCNLSSTTISTGSFLTSKKLDISPANSGLSSNNTEDRILRETVNSPWNSSASPMSTAQQGQGDSSEVSESQLPAEENVVSKRRSVQRIIDKYTKDFNWLPENNAAFHAPAVGLDLSDMERHFPHFHRQLFQPLEQSPDLDLSSSLSQYKISQDSKDCSKSSSFSTESQDTSTFLETTTSSRKMRNNNPRSCHEMKGLNKVSLQAEESLKENITLGSEESFHPLQLESTLNENGQSAEKTVDLSIVPESSSEQNPEIKNAESERCISLVGDQYEELRRNIENINFQSSVESLRSQSLSSLEEHSSFDQLNTTQIAVNKTPLAELSLKEDGEFGALCFDTVTPDKYQELNKTPVIAREANTLVEVASQRSTNVAEEEQGFLEAQMSCSMSRETYSKISAIPVEATVQESDPVLEMHEKQSHHSVLTISSGPCSSQAWVPVWETESGHGIMEEPELTLLSSNDITVAESDTDSIGQEEKRENEISTPACADQSEFKSCSEKRDFFPLEPKADCSIFTQPDCSAVTKRSREDQSLLHQSGVMLLEFTSTPASLQEAFLKKKKNFIHKSSERIQEIKNRESKKPQAKLFQRNKTERFHMLNEPSPTSGAAVSQLKKVGEVKVCSPEDRRSAETEIHQRASRLYNQLTEVKIRKEEKTRQEAYARNREKAKEFQKKTLEKLRARKTH
ncbi:centrosomal protein of 295 kDa isoform X2 [Alligator mississippiensis]|uniref:centrosomal protein of 295 kDa isoform X2 n=1 Tax=Alligator mississippiensis TaxID=8496 RepID=UPI0006ECB369|nr:centrosomal protein of 295 kDa isoform X2 [Alligator mississippiensis]